MTLVRRFKVLKPSHKDRRGHQRLTPRVLTDAQMAAVDAFDQACAAQGTPASTSPGSPWLSRIMGGTPSGSSPTSDIAKLPKISEEGCSRGRFKL